MENNAFTLEEEALMTRINSGNDLVSLKDIIDDYIYYRKNDFDSVDEIDPLADIYDDFYSEKTKTLREESKASAQESVEDKLRNILNTNNYDDTINTVDILNNIDDEYISETEPVKLADGIEIEKMNSLHSFNELPSINELDFIENSLPINEEEIVSDKNKDDTNNAYILNDLSELEELFNKSLKEISEYSINNIDATFEKKLDSIKVPVQYRSKINELLDKAFDMCRNLEDDLTKEKEKSQSIISDFNSNKNAYKKSKFDILNDNLIVMDLI